MNYFKPIVLLGFIVPSVVLFSLLAGGILAKSWLGDEYNKRKTAFEELRENEQKMVEMENLVLPYRGAVAYFSQMEKKQISQTLPTVVEELCSGSYQGYVIRTGLQIGDSNGKEEARMEFLGRYDSLQKLMSDLQVQFPFLKFSSGSFRPVEPTTSVPSKHLSVSFMAYNDVEPSQGEGGQQR